jgi:hypothetical protein
MSIAILLVDGFSIAKEFYRRREDWFAKSLEGIGLFIPSSGETWSVLARGPGSGRKDDIRLTHIRVYLPPVILVLSVHKI